MTSVSRSDCVAGIDLGGTSLAAGLVTPAGEWWQEVPANRATEEDRWAGTWE